MTETVKLRCTACQNGCQMEVEHEDGELIDTTGNLCMKGMASAQQQLNEMELEKSKS